MTAYADTHQAAPHKYAHTRWLSVPHTPTTAGSAQTAQQIQDLLRQKRAYALAATGTSPQTRSLNPATPRYSNTPPAHAQHSPPPPTSPASPGGVLGLSVCCWPPPASPLLRPGTAAAGWARPAAAPCSLVTGTPGARRREGCAHKPPRSTPYPHAPPPDPPPRGSRLTRRLRLLRLCLAVVCEAKEVFGDPWPFLSPAPGTKEVPLAIPIEGVPILSWLVEGLPLVYNTPLLFQAPDTSPSFQGLLGSPRDRSLRSHSNLEVPFPNLRLATPHLLLLYGETSELQRSPEQTEGRKLLEEAEEGSSPVETEESHCGCLECRSVFQLSSITFSLCNNQ